MKKKYTMSTLSACIAAVLSIIGFALAIESMFVLSEVFLVCAAAMFFYAFNRCIYEEQSRGVHTNVYQEFDDFFTDNSFAAH